MARKEEFMIMRSAILLSILCCGAVAGAVTQPAFFAGGIIRLRQGLSPWPTSTAMGYRM
jgi:hypothetical protein